MTTWTLTIPQRTLRPVAPQPPDEGANEAAIAAHAAALAAYVDAEAAWAAEDQRIAAIEALPVRAVRRIYDMGGGSYLADVDLKAGGETFAAEYAVHTEANDPAPAHGQLVTLIASGEVAALIKPAPVAAAVPVPDEISRRQFFQGLAEQSLVTEAEALAAVATGTIPSGMTTFIDGLPPEDRFGARMILSGSTVFQRSHPLTAAFGAMQGMTAAQLDDFWRFCAGL